MTNASDIHFTKLGENADLPLSQFMGKAVLVVNVASACGLTPQYRDLEALYKSRKGLIVLGVPCNDFGAQESGTEEEIASFCDTTYHVTFPMTGKVDILAREKRHPFYRWVVDQFGEDALPKWNFHKYLVGPDGKLLESFGSTTAPMAPEVTSAIDKALA